MNRRLILPFAFIFCLYFNSALTQGHYRPDPKAPPVSRSNSSDYTYDDIHSGCIAVSYGTPAAFNISVLYFYERLGFQFSTSGIYLFALIIDALSETESGVGTELASQLPFMGQLNLTAKLFSEEDRFLSLGVMGGTSVTRPKPMWMNLSNRYYYVGPSVHYVHKAFFMEVGYAFAKDIETNVSFRMPTYQLGLCLNF